MVDPNNQGEDRGIPFFPFGRGGGDVTPPVSNVDNQPEVDETDEPDVTDEVVILERLRQISQVPTAGGTVFSRTVEDNSLFSSAPEQVDVMRFIERSTGHLYETTGETNIVTRITNTTIPRVINAEFISGDQVLLQYIDPTSNAFKTFSAEVVEPSNTLVLENETRLSRLSGVFLQDNVRTLDINVSGEVLYGINEGNEFSLRMTDRNGNEVREIFNSQLTNWHPTLYGESSVVLTHAPSYSSFGKSFLLNTDTAVLSNLYSGKLALQTLPSPDGTKILMSFRDGREMSLYIFKEGELVDTGINTYAEKCVWSSDNTFAYCAEPLNDISSQAPDNWYKGIESYSDDVYQINTTNNFVDLLFSPFEEGSYSIDITKPELSLNERYMYFMDKETETFWTYQLEL